MLLALGLMDVADGEADGGDPADAVLVEDGSAAEDGEAVLVVDGADDREGVEDRDGEGVEDGSTIGMQRLFTQLLLTGQVPQNPPHASAPHSLPTQFGTQPAQLSPAEVTERRIFPKSSALFPSTTNK